MASSTSSILTRFFVFCNGIYHYSTIVVSVVILRFPECMSIGDDLPGIIMIDFIFISPVMPRWVQLKGEWKHSHFMCFYFTMHHHHITCIFILPCITIIWYVLCFFLQYITIISDVFLFYHASPSYNLYFFHHTSTCGFLYHVSPSYHKCYFYHASPSCHMSFVYMHHHHMFYCNHHDNYHALSMKTIQVSFKCLTTFVFFLSMMFPLST